MLYRPKPVVRTIVIATEDGICNTLEGPQSYKAGAGICTGEKGEQWPIPADQVLSRYEHVDGNLYRKKVGTSSIVDVVFLLAPTTLHREHGDMHGDVGAALVTSSIGLSQYIVARDIFDATYEPVT